MVAASLGCGGVWLSACLDPDEVRSWMGSICAGLGFSSGGLHSAELERRRAARPRATSASGGEADLVRPKAAERRSSSDGKAIA